MTTFKKDYLDGKRQDNLIVQNEVRWNDMCFEDLYLEYLDTYSSALADHLTNYFYYEFDQAETDKRIEEEGLSICEDERQNI